MRGNTKFVLALSSSMLTLSAGCGSSSTLGTITALTQPNWPSTVQDGVSGGTISAFGVAVDSSNNIYIGGTTTKAIDGQTLHGTADCFISKYNSSGTLVWTAEDGPSGGVAVCYGVALDSSGNVYAAGYTTAGIDGKTLKGTQDLYISMYNSSGTRQWTVEDGASGATVTPQSITLDTSGNIYIVGNVTGAAIDGQTLHGSQDIFLSKYNSSQTLAWTVEDGTSSGTANLYGVAVDTSGNIYSTGWTNRAFDGQTLHGSSDLILTKYNSSGTRQWTVEDGVSGLSAVANGLTLDSSGNPIIVGVTNGALDGQTLHGTNDFFISKYNTVGARQWTVQDGVASTVTAAYAPVVDTSGNIYVAGTTSGGLDSQTLHGSQDYFLTKYNSSGTRQWTIQDGVSSKSAAINSGLLGLDSFGDIYVVGFTGGGMDGQTQKGTTDLFITEYNSSNGSRL